MDGASLGLDDPRPSYRQVADALRAAITEGQLVAGDQLPTQRAIAEEHGVAVETVKRALTELRRDGLIVSRQGKGSYVRGPAAAEDQRSTSVPALVAAVEQLRSELADVQERLAALEARPPE